MTKVCSYCGKGKPDIKVLIENKDADKSICNECVSSFKLMMDNSPDLIKVFKYEASGV